MSSSSWNPLFIIVGLMEVVPALINYIRPTFLFPRANSAGVLAAQWWNAAAAALGLLCFMAVTDGTEDSSSLFLKSTTAIVMIAYHLSIEIMTLLRVAYDQQVDGPDPPPCCSLRCFNNVADANNAIKAMLGLSIHGVLAAALVAFLVVCSEQSQ